MSATPVLDSNLSRSLSSSGAAQSAPVRVDSMRWLRRVSLTLARSVRVSVCINSPDTTWERSSVIAAMSVALARTSTACATSAGGGGWAA